ncbi:MAG: GntR family transcriptional regulator [Acidimicrobiales bacterium]
MGVTRLDRSSPLPLWAQLEADLRRRLDDGEFDERFPTDGELVADYEVSRHTAREAVRHLNRTGLLRRERGRGTVVNRSEFEQPLGTVYSLFQSVEATGVEQTSEVLELGVVRDVIAANQLGLDDDADLVHVARLRFAADAPLAIDRAWLPLAIGEPLLEVDFTHTALYVELEKAGRPRPDQGWERLTPVVPTPADRERLGMRRSDAAFFLERLGLAGAEPVEWRTTTIRGDRYRFVSNWSTGRPGGSGMQLEPS